MFASPVGLRPAKDCAQNAQQQLKTATLSSERAPHVNKPVTVLK
jgi:hypothetical protein